MIIRTNDLQKTLISTGEPGKALIWKDHPTTRGNRFEAEITPEQADAIAEDIRGFLNAGEIEDEDTQDEAETLIGMLENIDWAEDDIIADFTL